jgi:hypothetical protein
MVLPSFPRGCKHDFCFAGLLTYSSRFRLPTRQRFPGSGKRRWKRLFRELTAAGLSGTFTRFPFHPQVRAKEPGRNKTATKIGIIFGLSYISDDFRHFVPLRNLYYFQLAVIVPQITNLRQRERVRVPVPVLTPPGVPASPWCSGRFAICRIGTESVNVKIRLDILMKT